MRFTALLALLAVSAVLAACGSSYGGSDDGKSDSSAASSTLVASAKKAKVGSVIVDAQGATSPRPTPTARAWEASGS